MWLPGEGTPIAWDELERLRVPASRGRPAGAIVGATGFGLMGGAVILARAAEGELTPSSAAFVEAVFVATGTAVGGWVSGLDPWRKASWVDF